MYNYHEFITFIEGVDKNNSFFVYRLSSPENNVVKYIGITKDLSARYRKHITQTSKRTLKNNWIKSLLKRGVKPIMTVIDGAETREEANILEKYWIIKHKDWGFDLKNMTNGGDGGDTMSGRKLTTEQRKKISDKNKGNKRPDLADMNRLRLSREVLQIDPETLSVIARFKSVSEASELTGCSKTNIAKFANGNIKPTIKRVGGYIWKYEDLSYGKAV